MKDEFMEQAIACALEGYHAQELPIGSVLVHDSKIISRGRNMRLKHQDPIAHAELVCLRNAGMEVPYAESVIYSTLSPCWMCAGAIRLYGIRKVVIADDGEGIEGSERWKADDAFYRAANIDLVKVPDEEMKETFRQFVKENPWAWRGDVGGTARE